MNIKGYFYSHENMSWHTTINKIVHPSLSEDMKGPMQNKKDKGYSLILLSKNQLYKLRQINKAPTIIKQDDMEFFPKCFCTSFTNVCNLLSCYHNSRILICRYQGVMLGIMICYFESFS